MKLNLTCVIGRSIKLIKGLLMKLDNLWEFFERNIFTEHSTPVLFNQYRNTNKNLDLRNGASIRRRNLKKYLESFHRRPRFLLVGEAPGHKGCRFSGVPFTSETQLCGGVLPFTGLQSSRFDSPERESTATIFWKIMEPYHPNFIAWNCVPFHPHKPGLLSSNRPPTRHEITTYSEMLKKVLKIVDPVHVVAVGKKAEIALNIVDADFVTVRHPSQGGAKKFEAAIKEVFASG